MSWNNDLNNETIDIWSLEKILYFEIQKDTMLVIDYAFMHKIENTNKKSKIGTSR